MTNLERQPHEAQAARPKALSLMLLGGLTIIIALLTLNQAHAVELKHNSIVSNSNITLGDVFYGLSDRQENKVLGPAPRPGKDMVLNARTLLRVAIAMDLPWRPTSVTDQITLTRDGTIIDRETIEKALKAALKEKGMNGKYNLAIKSTFSDIVLPPEMPADFEIADFDLKAERGSFKAVIVAPSKSNPIHRMPINGALERLVDIPVIFTPMRNGTVIGKNDIDMIEVREDALKHNTILNPQDLVGMTPRRILGSGQPILSNEIAAPIIVKRGEIVTMYFKNSLMDLTARGKALENGAKGDVIRLVNTGSSKAVEGRVTDTKEVVVSAF